MALERENIALQQELETIESVNLTLREQLDRVQTDNKTLNDENNFLRKKVFSFQQETANHHNEYSRIETELYQKSEEIERLKKDNLSFLKNKRDADRKLSEETSAFEKDRQAWHERESELVKQLKKALHVAVNNIGKGHQRKHSQTSNLNDDSPPESPTTSLYNAEREAKIAQRTIKEQDRFIYQLKTEIEKAKSATSDSLQLNKDLEFKIAMLGNELEQVKRMKRSLEEENETFQLLLHEKTIKGEFMLNPILQHNGLNNSRNGSRTSLREVTGVSLTDEINNALSGGKREKKGRRKHKVPDFTNLATELDRASASPAGERVQKESDQGVDSDDEQLIFSVSDLEKLQENIKSLQDENKCLKLYINKILDRIMEAQGFEEILSTDWSNKAPSQPSTPTVTTFDNIRNLSKTSNPTEPSPPIVPKVDVATANSPKKVGRRRTFSVFSSEKKIVTKTPQDDERADQLSPLPVSPTHTRNPSEGFLSPPPRRQRRNSSSDGGSSKRWSLWWNTNGKQQPIIERKEDPYMRPMVLVQDD